MKLKAQIQDSDYELSLEQVDDRVQANIDGRKYDLVTTKIAEGQYLVTKGSRVYECFVSNDPKRTRLFAVHISGERHEVELIDPKRLRSGQATGSHKDGAVEILATMPGKVVRVLVELGAAVEAGAGIVVVEAMKMQNEMKTPKDGTVVALNARTGSTVNAGEILAVIE
jgi:biotin carboxyl carrier protein